MSAARSAPVVSSATEWSCGLACLESLARERGLPFSQADLIARFRERYPLWKEKPGACGLHIRVLGREQWLIEWELLDLARHLGLASGARLLPDAGSLRRRLAGVDAAVLALTRRSRQEGSLTELNHAFRVLEADAAGLEVMDPGRRGGGRRERLAWADFLALEPLVFDLLRPAGNLRGGAGVSSRRQESVCAGPVPA